MKKRIALLCFLGSFIVAGLGLSSEAYASSHHTTTIEIKVNMINSKGESVGTASLTEQHDGVHIHVKAANLPAGTHGIHFHAVGKCEAPSFESAGSHFNTTKKEHGFNNPKGFHVGDLPNITVGADGTVDADIITKNVTLAKKADNSLLRSGGTAIVIHEKEDDYKTDPSGNSGSRIACGVIQQ